MSGTFVSIGNSPRRFSRLLNEIKNIYSELPKPVIVQHGWTPFESENMEIFAFTDDARFRELISNCDVFITHAGGGSVLTAIRTGQTPVVVPRLARFNEHVDDHQVALASEFAKIGSAVAVDEIKNLSQAVEVARARPRGIVKGPDNGAAIKAIKSAIDELAPDPRGGVAVVTPSGGHLTEVLALFPTFRERPHFFIINTPIVEPPEMKGITKVITLSERDWKFVVNFVEAFSILRENRPKVIFTTGGGFSVAFALAGKLLGIRTVYVETVGKVVIPTITGRFMHLLADRFFYQWRNLASHFPRGQFIGLVL